MILYFNDYSSIYIHLNIEYHQLSLHTQSLLFNHQIFKHLGILWCSVLVKVGQNFYTLWMRWKIDTAFLESNWAVFIKNFKVNSLFFSNSTSVKLPYTSLQNKQGCHLNVPYLKSGNKNILMRNHLTSHVMGYFLATKKNEVCDILLSKTSSYRIARMRWFKW